MLENSSQFYSLSSQSLSDFVKMKMQLAESFHVWTEAMCRHTQQKDPHVEQIHRRASLFLTSRGSNYGKNEGDQKGDAGTLRK